MATPPAAPTPARRAHRGRRDGVDGSGGEVETGTVGSTTRDADATVRVGVTTPAADAAPVNAETPSRLVLLRERLEAWWAIARRRIDAVTRTIRPLGWVMLTATVLLWVVAVSFGWQEMIIAAVILTAIIVISVPFLFGGTAYDVDLDLTRTHVVVGERAIGGLTLVNGTARSILPSRVVLPVGSGRGEFDVPRLAPQAMHEELFAIPTTARGVLAVGPVSVLRGDPLGLFERSSDRRQAVDLYVHPRTTPLEGLSLGRLRDLEGLPSSQLARDDVSFHALREYQPGDDLRHVHWKSTARVGDLMMRQYEETRRSHFVLGLSTYAGDYSDPDEFELAISAAGSIGLRALRDSRMLEARTQRGPLRTQGPRRLLDNLSALEHSRQRDGGIVALAGTIAANSHDVAIVVLFCGSGVDSAELKLACSRLPQGVRALAVVADSAVESPLLRRVGDADVVSISALDQLPPAIRKVLS
ncbi:DUF58 domain-containing protein [Microbacterium imperiale]|uniref:DUF58 domain-containing protein n=1 Tax=Microbacterium imperiale TaxID=33884 RepID=A0A9W6HHB8_9MICO|nr:DUF58 domain-containing protein [Microbacterium imperiale]MBP2421220.1 hypothetical protein [Microbacterium imperiale]MDS0199669.1 DUF58 domain-containing protein [Microbacterium imperiale]BFE41560.1 DUF58 domain-containing protein [Microbacterium imperiale]GLJ80511.1 hypothetical protein GCM10017586_21940 [Microbacterium imperiale]